jgi:hypothetical protein
MKRITAFTWAIGVGVLTPQILFATSMQLSEPAVGGHLYSSIFALGLQFAPLISSKMLSRKLWVSEDIGG